MPEKDNKFHATEYVTPSMILMWEKLKDIILILCDLVQFLVVKH